MGNILKSSKIRKRSTRNYKCTNIEKIVRNGLYSKGYRYRVNVRSLKGRPDLVLSKYNAIIFVNGCYWHAHNCDLFKIPSSNRGIWLKRFGETVDRDEKNIKLLIMDGWRVCVIWECALKSNIHNTIEAASSWILSDKKFFEIEKETNSFSKKILKIPQNKEIKKVYGVNL